MISLHRRVRTFVRVSYDAPWQRWFRRPALVGGSLRDPSEAILRGWSVVGSHPTVACDGGQLRDRVRIRSFMPAPRSMQKDLRTAVRRVSAGRVPCRFDSANPNTPLCRTEPVRVQRPGIRRRGRVRTSGGADSPRWSSWPCRTGVATVLRPQLATTRFNRFRARIVSSSEAATSRRGVDGSRIEQRSANAEGAARVRNVGTQLRLVPQSNRRPLLGTRRD